MRLSNYASRLENVRLYGRGGITPAFSALELDGGK
jgi:hypothetical protein